MSLGLRLSLVSAPFDREHSLLGVHMVSGSEERWEP